MHEALLAKSTFGARSGCVKSSPVSMSPTSTDLLPPLIARAAGAPIWSMSHCKPDRGSPPGAGIPASASSGDEPVSATLPSSCVAKPVVATAPDTCAFAPSFCWKVGLSELAITTPIWP